MRTFLAIILYATMVAALDVSGAVWNSLRSARAAKTTEVAGVTAKTESAVRVAGTIPSDT